MIARTIARWEFQGSLRSYWFLANAAVLLAGGALLMALGGSGGDVLGYRTHARVLAALVQLSIFVVPLMALIPSTAAIAADRELGTLDYLLAQPVTPRLVFLGKWSGIAVALLLSLVAALGFTGVIAALRGVPTGLIAGVLALTALLATAFVSVGMAVSAIMPTRGRAASMGFFVWLSFLALGSLAMMAALVRWGAPAWTLQAWSLINPIEAYRLAALSLMDAELSLLGPIGASMIERLGVGGLRAAAVGSLLVWTAAGFRAGRQLFENE